MRPEAYELLANRQETYWWHRARRALAVSLLQNAGVPEGCRWIDLGCGPGGNLHLLDKLHPMEVVGVDVSTIALSIAERRVPGVKLVRADLNETLPFGAATFDVATIFNVLYHDWIASEGRVLSEAARILRKDGMLLLTEPAFPELRRQLDDVVMTRRRYHLHDFAEMLENRGFEPLFGSYFTSFGVPIVLATKLFRRLRPMPDAVAPEMQPLHATVNEALFGAAMVEAWLITRGTRMPVGTTLIYVAKRR